MRSAHSHTHFQTLDLLLLLQAWERSDMNNGIPQNGSYLNLWNIEMVCKLKTLSIIVLNNFSRYVSMQYFTKTALVTGTCVSLVYLCSFTIYILYSIHIPTTEYIFINKNIYSSLLHTSKIKKNVYRTCISGTHFLRSQSIQFWTSLKRF